MTDPLLDAIDARIDAKLAAVESRLMDDIGSTNQYVKLNQVKIGNLEVRIAALEPKPQPDTKPDIVSGLSIKDGRFQLNGKPFTDFSACVAGNAIVSTTRQERRDIFKRIQDAGGRMVRILHANKNTSDDGISEYQPSVQDWIAGLPCVQESLDDLADLGMLVWLTCHHRQRYTDADMLNLPMEIVSFLTSPRPSGIVRGEISDGFLWFPYLESTVESFCDRIARQFGTHPALGLLTIANEKLSVRSPSYWVGERVNPGSSYKAAWFKRLEEYYAATGKTDKDIDKAGTLEFQSWNGVQVYRRLYQRLRDAGVTCPIGSSPIYGDCNMAGLVEASCLDFTDIHVYPSSVSSLPDPFLENDTRTIQSIANACRVVGKPLCSGEYAGVQEGKVRLESFYPCLDAVARAGFDASSYYAWNLGKPGNAGLYDAGDDSLFVKEFGEVNRSIPGIRYIQNRVAESFTWGNPAPKQLVLAEIFGAKVGTTYQPPPVPGTQPWSKEVGGVVLPKIAWLKE